MGYSSAIGKIEEMDPYSRETVQDYAQRLEDVLRALRKEFYNDPDDEDGFATGAVVESINIVRKLCI